MNCGVTHSWSCGSKIDDIDIQKENRNGDCDCSGEISTTGKDHCQVSSCQEINRGLQTCPAEARRDVYETKALVPRPLRSTRASIVAAAQEAWVESAPLSVRGSDDEYSDPADTTSGAVSTVCKMFISESIQETRSTYRITMGSSQATNWVNATGQICLVGCPMMTKHQRSMPRYITGNIKRPTQRFKPVRYHRMPNSTARMCCRGEKWMVQQRL